jgi:hypothetical protein
MQYSAIADLHTFQFTVAHTLGFSVSTSRLLATDLRAETSTQITTVLHIESICHMLNLHRLTFCTLLYSSSLRLYSCQQLLTYLFTHSLLASAAIHYSLQLHSRDSAATVSLSLPWTLNSTHSLLAMHYSLAIHSLAISSLTSAYCSYSTVNSNSQLNSLSVNCRELVTALLIQPRNRSWKTHVTWSQLSYCCYVTACALHSNGPSTHYSKHMSCDIPATVAWCHSAPANQTRGKHSFLYCCVTHCVHRAFSQQCIDQIRYNTQQYTIKESDENKSMVCQDPYSKIIYLPSSLYLLLLVILGVIIFM